MENMQASTFDLRAGKDRAMMDVLMMVMVVGFFWGLVKVVDDLSGL